MPPLSNACTEVAYTSDSVLAIDIGTPCRDDKKTTLTSDLALTIDIGAPYKDDYSFAAFRPEPGSDAAHSVTASVEGRPSSGVSKDFANLMPIGSMPSSISRRVGSWTVNRYGNVTFVSDYDGSFGGN